MTQTRVKIASKEINSSQVIGDIKKNIYTFTLVVNGTNQAHLLPN